METHLTPSEEFDRESPLTTSDSMFNGETFSSGNGDEIVVEALESLSDGRDENCKHCQ